MMMIKIAQNAWQSFWSVYNSQDSMLPFYLPLTVWLSAYLYCTAAAPVISLLSSLRMRNDSKEKKQASAAVADGSSSFHRWYAIHNLHNGGAILLGSLSIYSASSYNTTATATQQQNELLFTFNERIPILWSLSYFGVDIVDCCVRGDITYLLHALFCAGLGYANYSSPAVLQRFRMNSKATYCELSNPFMHRAKRTREPRDFCLFAFVFTCCRMLWIPFLYAQLLGSAGMRWNEPIPMSWRPFTG
jgi:hypothetical protein